MAFAAVTIFLVLVVLIGQFFLQYWLCTREEKWLGIILPAVCFVLGLGYAFAATTLPAAAGAFVAGGGLACTIHLILYRIGRNRVQQRKRDRLEKMNIQDLG